MSDLILLPDSIDNGLEDSSFDLAIEDIDQNILKACSHNKTLERLEYYLSHPDYKWLFSPYRYIMIHGGRGSGKSFSMTESLIIWSDLIRDRFLLCREHMNSISDSCHSLMIAHIENLNLQSRFKITKTGIVNRATGSEFLYKGLKTNINSVKSLNGIGFCFVEEAQAVSAESWKILLPTIREKGSKVMIACNPEEEQGFMYQRWIENPCNQTVSIQVNYDKNQYFPAELENERLYALSLIDSAPTDDARLQAQADYDWVWLGKPKKILASQIIRRAVLLEFETPDNVEFMYGLDFGFSVDPNALTRSFIIGDDLYIDYEAVGRVEIDELPQLLDSVPGVRDWPIYCDAARPETISALRRAGFDASAAEKWAGSVEDGISYLNQFNRIYVHPRCTYTWDETKKYRYKVDKVSGAVLPVIVDKDNHCIDSIRYGNYTKIRMKEQGFFDIPRYGGQPQNPSSGWFG